MAALDAELLEALSARLETLSISSSVERGDDHAPDQLFIELSPDGEGRVLYVQLLFLGDLADPSVLQYYVGLPTRANQESIPLLTRFINVTNAMLPIGGFGLLESDGVVYFRENVPVVVDPFDVDLVGWTVTMIDYIIGNVGGLVEQVGRGLDYELALRQLGETLARLAEV